MAINLKEEFSKIEKFFSPKIIGEVNDQFVKLTKIRGEEVPWHTHENEDELFYVIKGSLVMELENQPLFGMKEGDLFIVKKGVNHRVSSQQECWIMLVETKTTKHTGNVQSAITRTIEEQQ